MRLTPIKAIRRKCLECSSGSYREVRNCIDELCPLWPYRLGKDPARAGVGGGPQNFKPRTPVRSFDAPAPFPSKEGKNSPARAGARGPLPAGAPGRPGRPHRKEAP